MKAPRITRELNIDTEFVRAEETVQLGERDRLRFARQILLFLFVICVFVFAGYYAQPENRAGAAIFELVKIGVPPLVTLVIGFYFPNKK